MEKPFKIGDIITFLNHPAVDVEILNVITVNEYKYEYDYRVLRQENEPEHVGNIIRSREITSYGPVIRDTRTKLSKLINSIYIQEKKNVKPI